MILDLDSVLNVCKAYRGLGDAVADQLLAVVQDDSEESLSEQNSNALRYCADWLDEVVFYIGGDAGEEAAELAAKIREWITPPADYQKLA